MEEAAGGDKEGDFDALKILVSAVRFRLWAP